MGLYDVAYLRTLPGMTIMAPRNEFEVAPMLDLALSLGTPAALRLSPRLDQREAR